MKPHIQLLPCRFTLTPTITTGGGQAVVMFKRHFKFSLDWFIGPFSLEIWLLILASFLFYSLILFFDSHLNKKCRRSTEEEKEEGPTDKGDFTIWESFSYFSLASVVMGHEKQPESMGGKVLRQLWGTFYLIVIVIYTANLVAFFSAALHSKPLISLEDILSPPPTMNVFTLTKYKNTIESIDNPILNRMSKNAFHRVNFIGGENATVSEEAALAVQKLKEGQIWLDFDMNIDRIMEAQDHINVFYTLDGYFTSIDYGFLMRKDWDY